MKRNKFEEEQYFKTLKEKIDKLTYFEFIDNFVIFQEYIQQNLILYIGQIYKEVYREKDVFYYNIMFSDGGIFKIEWDDFDKLKENRNSFLEWYKAVLLNMYQLEIVMEK